MNSRHKQKQSQLGQGIVRCGWKAQNRLFILCFVTQNDPKLDFEPNQHDLSRKRWSPKSPVNDVRASACSAIFHIHCPIVQCWSCLREGRDANTKKWWRVRWKRGWEFTMNCVTSCLKQANTKNDSTYEMRRVKCLFWHQQQKGRKSVAWDLVFVT